MELRHVEAFLHVAQELHFGRAATKMGVSQGRVSQVIQELERKIGAPLFLRTSRQVQLTKLGDQFYDGVRNGYDQLVETVQACRARAQVATKEFRIVYQASISGFWVSRIVSEIARSALGCQFVLNSFVPQVALNVSRTLQTLQADMGMMWAPDGDGSVFVQPHLIIGPVASRAQRGVLVPEGHPLVQCRQVMLEDLLGYPVLRLPDALDRRVREQWTPSFTDSGKKLSHTSEDICEMTGREDVPDEDLLILVAQGRGLHLTVTGLLDRMPFPGLVMLPVLDMLPAAIVPMWLDSRETAITHALADAAAAGNVNLRPAFSRPGSDRQFGRDGGAVGA